MNVPKALEKVARQYIVMQPTQEMANPKGGFGATMNLAQNKQFCDLLEAALADNENEPLAAA